MTLHSLQKNGIFSRWHPAHTAPDPTTWQRVQSKWWRVCWRKHKLDKRISIEASRSTEAHHRRMVCHQRRFWWAGAHRPTCPCVKEGKKKWLHILSRVTLNMARLSEGPEDTGTNPRPWCITSVSQQPEDTSITQVDGDAQNKTVPDATNANTTPAGMCSRPKTVYPPQSGWVFLKVSNTVNYMFLLIEVDFFFFFLFNMTVKF